MDVLVTGANGFLGSWVTKRLVEDGHKVKILRRERSDISQIAALDIEHCIGDVTDLPSLIKACSGMDSVFHIAGLIGYKASLRNAMEAVNVTGTQNVISACKKNNIHKLLYLSSVVAIGAGRNRHEILNEDSEFNLHKYNLGYFETKHAAEKLVIAATQRQEVEAAIVNPSTVYGPGDARKGSRKTQVKVAQGRFPFYTNGGVNIVNIADVVDAIMVAVERAKAGERYILAGENISIKQLFTFIAEAAGVEPPKYCLPDSLLHGIGFVGDCLEKVGLKGPISQENAVTASLYHWFDSSKAQRELNLKVTPAQESIRQSVQWMKENQII